MRWCRDCYGREISPSARLGDLAFQLCRECSRGLIRRAVCGCYGWKVIWSVVRSCGWKLSVAQTVDWGKLFCLIFCGAEDFDFRGNVKLAGK